MELNPFAKSATEISSTYFKCRLTSLWDDKNECSELCVQINGEDYFYNVNRKCEQKPNFVWNARFTFDFDLPVTEDNFKWLKAFKGNREADESSELIDYEPSYN